MGVFLSPHHMLFGRAQKGDHWGLETIWCIVCFKFTHKYTSQIFVHVSLTCDFYVHKMQCNVPAIWKPEADKQGAERD